MYYESPSMICISSDVVDDPVRNNLPHVLAHEIGHAVEVQKMSDAARTEFMELRGLDTSQDWRDLKDPWALRPQEDFAEVFAALDSPSFAWPIQTLGGRIRNEQALRALIQRYQPGPSRPVAALGLPSVEGELRTAAQTLVGDTRVMLALCGLGIVHVAFSAVQSMRRYAPWRPLRRIVRWRRSTRSV
jgi:hypothetical protein